MSDTAGGRERALDRNSPSGEFAAWCEAEFERRRNTGETFDEAHYRQAMELVLDKLQRLEEEGRA